MAKNTMHTVIAGAIFDFMGWLTTRDRPLTLSARNNAGPAAQAVSEFLEMRQISSKDAAVEDWNKFNPWDLMETTPKPHSQMVQELVLPVFRGNSDRDAKIRIIQEWQSMFDLALANLKTFGSSTPPMSEEAFRNLIETLEAMRKAQIESMERLYGKSIAGK